MKVVVEWGKPKSACATGRPCGVSGQFVVDNLTQAAKLASQLFHTLTEGRDANASRLWRVSAAVGRYVRWSENRDAWVALTLLDGTPRGAYAALADKESQHG